MNQSNSLGWYLIFTKPKQENLAKENLEQQGFKVYLPLIKLRAKSFVAGKARVQPLFPRYMFAHLDAVNDDWSPIRSTRGVSALVSFGQKPAQVPEGLIDALRAQEDPEGNRPLSDKGLQHSQRVRIEAGPMKGYEGIFLARTSRDRVLILLDIVGHERRLITDMDSLEDS